GCAAGTKRRSTELLFSPDEADVARLVLGRRRAHGWKAKAAILEREGLPPIDPFMGGRPLEKLKRFFAMRDGLEATPAVGVSTLASSRVRVIPLAPDGAETPDAEKEAAIRGRRFDRRPRRARS